MDLNDLAKILADNPDLAKRNQHLTKSKTKNKTPAPASKTSHLERRFLEMIGNEKPEQEYRFHPIRKWRFDFAWPASLVAVEIEGGTYRRGRHVRPEGYANDCEKYNSATAMGWRVFRLTGDMLTRTHIEPIITFIHANQSQP